MRMFYKISFRRLFYLLSLTLVCHVIYGSTKKKNDIDREKYISIPYCQLIERSNEYDGKKVVVRGSYRYGEEWQELFGLKCRTKKTYLEYEPETEEAESAITRSLKKTPHYQGTINATFYGTFKTKNGSFGDGSYDFKFIAEYVENVEIVSKEGWVPEKLPDNLQLKMCQGDEMPTIVPVKMRGHPLSH
jgi:hypothetical protein